MGDRNEEKEMLREEVGAWIEWARRELPRDGNIPPIFNTYEPWESWWSNSGDPPWISWFYGCPFEDIDQEGPQLLSTFEESFLADPSEVAARFVALSIYYSLAHLPSVYAEGFVSEARDRHAKNLAYLTCLVPAEDCHDWRTTRWEILNAYVISDWDRALELYNRAERLNLLPLAEIQVLRAQFRFLAAFGKATQPSLDSLFWPPDVYSPGSVCSECLYLGGLTSAKRKYAFANCDNEMLRHAAVDLETALAQRDDLSPAYRAVLAR